MHHVRDLYVEEEILPLFDFVHHEYARDALLELLSQIPASLHEVFERRQILRELMRHKPLYLPCSYRKSEFNEVRTYLENLKNEGADLTGIPLMAHLFFARTKRNREAGRLAQLVMFLHKIDQAYFAHLGLSSSALSAPSDLSARPASERTPGFSKPPIPRDSGFPTSFALKIAGLTSFLADLDVAKYQAIARRRPFTIGEIVQLGETLLGKIRTGEMDAWLQDFCLFEAYLSISQGIRKHDFVFPEFSDADFSILDFYHPLLKSPVKNTLRMQETVTLITGPNMSGKSTLLKAVGICVLLAHLGLAVPASQCELPFFDVISISINLHDDLLSGYSHFMTEIRSLKQVVIQADNGRKCFAVFDELFRGTNAEDALAISRTTITGLTRFSGSRFFISTHLHQLKEAVAPGHKTICPDAYFIECILDHNKPVFTYRLREGWSDLKIGQILFEQAGLNELLKK